MTYICALTHSLTLFCEYVNRHGSYGCVSGMLIPSSLVYFREFRELLEKCAATALSSKMVAGHKEFFAKMVVDAVQMLDDLLPLNMIGIKKVQGGSLEVKSVTFTIQVFISYRHHPVPYQ